MSLFWLSACGGGGAAVVPGANATAAVTTVTGVTATSTTNSAASSAAAASSGAAASPAAAAKASRAAAASPVAATAATATATATATAAAVGAAINSGPKAVPVSPISPVAVSSGLPYVAAYDSMAKFTAPGGQSVEVLVKGPVGVTANLPCPGAKCYVMRAIEAGETPDAYFPAAVAAAVAANARKLVIPKGTYNFQGPAFDPNSANPNTCNEGNYWNCNPHWTIGTYPATPMGTPNSITDLDIDLRGSVLNFAAPGTGIYILNVERLRLENFTIDWPKLRVASLGTIAADPANPGHNALVLDNAYPAIDPLTGAPVQIQAVDPWDDSTAPAIAPGRFDLSANNANETYFIFGPAPQPNYLGSTGAGAQAFSCEPCNFVNSPTDATCSMYQGCANFDGFAIGARVIVRHYTYNGFALFVNWSNDVDFEHVNILTGPGMGIAVQNDGGFRGFRFAYSSIARAPGRIISTASDGINISQMGGDVMIANDVIAYQGDDAINLSPAGESIASTATRAIGVNGVCEPDLRDLAVAGDTLAFFDGNGNYLGNAAVTALQGSPCSVPLQTLLLPCPGSAACAALVGCLSAADSFVDLTQQPVARFIVSNNTFEDNRGHGTVLTAPLGEVIDNIYDWNSMGSWNLSGLATSNVLFTGNVTYY